MRTRINRWIPNPRLRLLVGRLIFFALLFGLWEGLAQLKIWPDYLFPSPLKVFATLVSGFEDRTFLIGIGGSLRRLLQGYLAATLIGLSLGVVMAQVRWFKDTFGLLVLGLQTLPSVCWLPLALLWFGLNENAILFVIIMGAVLSIAQSTEDGIRNTARVYTRAGRNLGARNFRLYFEVILPSALPSIITGMKLGWSFAWRSLMAGELLYTLPGLGNLLNMGRELNDMSQVIAVILVIIVLGLISDRLVFGMLEKRVRERWGLG
jgi:NitT/TauT family transport system permease protein